MVHSEAEHHHRGERDDQLVERRFKVMNGDYRQDKGFIDDAGYTEEGETSLGIPISDNGGRFNLKSPHAELGYVDANYFKLLRTGHISNEFCAVRLTYVNYVLLTLNAAKCYFEIHLLPRCCLDGPSSDYQRAPLISPSAVEDGPGPASPYRCYFCNVARS